jgi:hypothetical protein
MSRMLTESKIQKNLAPTLLPRVTMMARQFLPSLWTVALLLKRGRGFFQTSALMHRKLLISNFFLDGFVLF